MVLEGMQNAKKRLLEIEMRVAQSKPFLGKSPWPKSNSSWSGYIPTYGHSQTFAGSMVLNRRISARYSSNSRNAERFRL